MSAYQPKTGAACSCRPGVQRDNCPTCEGTGMAIDFRAVREAVRARQEALAELGAKCLEILSERDVRGVMGDPLPPSWLEQGPRIMAAARSLGLLSDDDRRTLPERLKDLGAAAERLAATSRPDDDEGGKA